MQGRIGEAEVGVDRGMVGEAGRRRLQDGHRRRRSPSVTQKRPEVGVPLNILRGEAERGAQVSLRLHPPAGRLEGEAEVVVGVVVPRVGNHRPLEQRDRERAPAGLGVEGAEQP